MRHKQTYTSDSGGYGQPIILLHGFLASSTYWRKLEQLLDTKDYRIITIDLLGFGRAPKPKNASYDYDTHMSHLKQAISCLDLSSPPIIVGHSMGALLAARYAVLHPNRVGRSVLLNPPLYRDSDQARETLRNTNRLYRFLLDSKLRQAGWQVVKLLPNIAPHSKLARELSLKNVIEKAQIFDDLSRIETDTLLVVGEEDRAEYLVNLENEQVSESVKVELIPTKHHSPITHAADICRIINAFIRTE